MRSTFLIALPSYVAGPTGPTNKIEQMVQGKSIEIDTVTYQVPVYNSCVESVEGFEWCSDSAFRASAQGASLVYRLTRGMNGELVGFYRTDPQSTEASSSGRFSLSAVVRRGSLAHTGF